jgi:spermidine synthase
MIRWVQLGAASIPGSGGELRLMQRGVEFSIFTGSIELMSSRRSGSEQALASMTCARVMERARPHILIGGLGMGFTLRSALAALGPHASITVAELVPEVVAWARGPLAAIYGKSLSDPRLKIFKGDVGEMIDGVQSGYDAILLDVDNGPTALMCAANDDLYNAYGLRKAQKALLPGGVLAVWLAAPDPAFTQRLQAAGYSVEEHRVRANGRQSGSRHVIWLATKVS